ncbi:hypothetical protein SPAB_01136 [Salmonella enterica subsp. enterica serovar Paratyphi B str. SPB7]|uniref:Uncharacterized protein n=1 Tax=Salmonella paratyphi B (strain ATCC BAA-1250 / SPB7) TaxID=1016998 RepID=A0A6C6YZV8_SALPB|nr:hypothetical protein SPAB_01136 [Salmonella enterica subsp. enterica serovar Paratyphi B str. SPB7]
MEKRFPVVREPLFCIERFWLRFSGYSSENARIYMGPYKFRCSSINSSLLNRQIQKIICS